MLPVALLGGGGFWAFNQMRGTLTCTTGFTLAGQAIRQYANENKGVLPNAKTWQTDILKQYTALAEPMKSAGPVAPWAADAEWSCVASDGTKTGIAFNSDLSGKKLAEIQDELKTIVLFEVEKVGANQSEPFKERAAGTGPVFMMGQRRSWMTVNVAGNLDVKDSQGNPLPLGDGAVKVDTSSEAQAEEIPEKAGEKAPEKAPQ